jgi:hypothetical protein
MPLAALGIAIDAAQLKWLVRSDRLQEAALMVCVLVATGSCALIHPWHGRSRTSTTPVIHSIPRLQLTTILSVFAVLSMIAGLAFGTSAGGGAPSAGLYQPPAVLVQTARHLEWLWLGAAAGMVFAMAAAIAQPWFLHTGTATTVCVLAAEICTLFLFLSLHNTFAALGVALLHLTVANALWSTTLWQNEPLDVDLDHDERWLEHHQGNV